MKVKYFDKSNLCYDFLSDFAHKVDTNRLVIRKTEQFPLHSSIDNLNLIVINGTLTLSLNGQKASDYPAGSLVYIPIWSQISISNQNEEDLDVVLTRA
jgi:quercetin dioxygenase-like cupin family protein